MRRLVVIAATFSVAIAACGGDIAATTTAAPSTAPASSTTSTTRAPATTQAPTTTEASGFVAISDDGRVTIDVAPEALATDPGIAMTPLDPADQPEEMAGLPSPPWVYALEPGTLQFDAPVRISVEIPFDEFAAEGFEDATPLATLVTTGSDGTGWELLGDQTIRRDGDTVTISGTTDHFSRMAVLNEQVFIETRFVEVNQDFVASIGVDFRGLGGDPLSPPPFGTVAFAPEASAPGTDAFEIGYQDGLVTLMAPPGVTTLTGDLRLELQLAAAETAGNTALISAPRLTTIDQTAATIEVGISLAVRPTISDDETVRLDISVDHPGGAEIVPGGDFLGGLSALYVDLRRAFPGLFVGLIGDTDGDGMIGPQDIMYPPQAASVAGDTTTVVLPLFGYGDYFLYFLDGTPPLFGTSLTVTDGATALLGGLTPEQTAVPLLNRLPYVARVFSQESRSIEDVELMVFITPQIFELTE